MVAISLYRGNLHRVPGVPRRWVMPRPRISVKEFRGLLRRRSKAFTLLRVGEALVSTSAPSTVYNGNPPPPPRSLPPTPPPPPPKQQHWRQDQQIEEEDAKPGGRDLTFPVPLGVENSEGNANQEDRRAEDADAEELYQLANSVSLVEVEEVSGDAKADLQVEKNKAKEVKDEEIKNQDPDYSESDHKLNVANDKEKRKKEVEEKLEILNKRKHNLVQALKQILSLEEELKRRSSMQPTRPSVPVQVDISNDSGSMTRVTTPKMASEANAVLNHDLQPRQFPRISSISPSAESALKRPSYFSA